MKTLPTLLLLLCLTTALHSQEITVPRDSAERFVLADTTNEAIYSAYIQTDRQTYYPGEIIAFKIYAFNFGSLNHNTDSVRIGLFNSHDSLTQQISLPNLSLANSGYLKLPSDLPYGYYSLKSEYPSSTKKIEIGKEGNDFMITPQNFTVSFYPEGGHLIYHSMCRVAIKAEYQKDLPAEITGNIIDDEGNNCGTFASTHNGIGSFTFMPDTSRSYYALCTDSYNQQHKVELPIIEKEAYSLVAVMKKENLVITRHMPVAPVDTTSQYILIYAGKQVIYWNQWKLNVPNLSLKKEQLPAGLLKIVLFDNHFNILSARNILSVDKTTEALTEIRLRSVDKRLFRYISGQLVITNKSGKPLQCDLSLSAVEPPNFSKVNDTESLCSFVNLPYKNVTPDAFYFNPEEKYSGEALDELMLTQQESRFYAQHKDSDIAKEIMLPQLIVKANAPNKKQKLSFYAAFSDRHIDQDEIQKRKITEVMQALRGHPDIRIMPDNTLRIRGAQSTPLIVIDDIPLSYTTSIERWRDCPPLEGLQIDDIERIDVLEGPRAAIFGMNGGNGAICITTKGAHLDDEKIAGAKTERTLLWQSDLRSDTNGTVNFSFIIPMSVKAIHFSIEGVSKNGEIVSCKKDIEVDEIK